MENVIEKFPFYSKLAQVPGIARGILKTLIGPAVWPTIANIKIYI